MNFRLQTILPNGTMQTSPVRPYGFQGYEEWLEHMVTVNPDVIFFYTVDSTDIWPAEEKEIDFNTVVFKSDVDGVIHHTYNLRCPAGCYGQWDECVYKKHPYLAEQDQAYLNETLPKE